MLVSPHKQIRVLNKTKGKCSTCGCTEDLACACFIPEWTRVEASHYNNLIPLCPECWSKYYGAFIEIGKLQHLPKLEIEVLMRFYKDYVKFLYRYVMLYGKKKRGVDFDVTQALLILESYNVYLRTHLKELDWESYTND